MTTKLALSLLGTVAITLNGERINRQVPAKSQALLCYLAVTGGRHSREKLAGLLWGDKPEARANASLRKALSNLRKLSESALVITRQTVVFNRDNDYWLDVEVLESALAGETADPQTLQSFREAVDLYRGEFLAGFSVRQAVAFEEWVLGERERLRQMVLQACTERSECACTEWNERVDVGLPRQRLAQACPACTLPQGRLGVAGLGRRGGQVKA